MSKLERQAAILRLVDERELATQDEVVRALHDAGVDAVQATVSRDIAQLGLVKVRSRDGRLVYARPGTADADRLGALSAGLRRFAIGVEAAGGLVVVRTPPGHANALALAFDAAALPDVAGCIAGDDTIFLAVREGRTASDLAQQLVELGE
jgi:transcriptional regulator of arginine metabolism